MKSILKLLALLLLIPLAAIHAAETKSKPNILLIYTDDHGWADLGLQGVDKDIRTRTSNGGKGTVMWRVKSDKDFSPNQSATFDWPGGQDWQEVKVELPIQGRLIHLRIKPSEPAAEMQIQSITLRAHEAATQTFRFNTQK